MTIGYVPAWLPSATPASPAPAAPAKVIRRGPTRGQYARYDAAQDSPTDRHHWNYADDLSAAAANSPDVRMKLRRRSRYECANNSYLAGLLATMGNDLIGSGPRLQLTVPTPAGAMIEPGDPPSATPDALYAAAREVEKSFADWCRAINLADKLRIMVEAGWRDGESFGLFTTNPALPNPVKLDLRVIECDLVTDPTMSLGTTPGDGINYDAAGNPTSYAILRQHPGDTFGIGLSMGQEFDRVPARTVIHWFRIDRPGQLRGIPATTPCLALGAQLRRYVLATLTNAEYGASVAGILETDLSSADAANVDFSLYDEVEVVRGKLLTTPANWKLSQLNAAQPTSSFNDFKNSLLNEMGRAFLAPFNVIAGNSSGYNYSSGRLDHLPYHRSLWSIRGQARYRALDRIFLAWWEEADSRGLIPDILPPVNLWTIDYHWDAFASIDPVKDVSAAKDELALGLTTRAELCAARGLDWRETADELAAERAYMISVGLNPDAETSATPAEPQELDENGDPVPQPTGVKQTGGTASTRAVSRNVQATALNGAQIASLVLICDKLATDQYPADGAEAMIEGSFPEMDRSLIKRMVNSLSKFDPPKPIEPPPVAKPLDPSRNGAPRQEAAHA